MSAKTAYRKPGLRVGDAVPARKAGVAKSAAAHILSAPKGPRTVSHRKMKDAVEKVFRERAHTGA